jgi:hypothetical protein
MKYLISISFFLFFSLLVFSQKADDLIGKYRLSNGLDIVFFKYNNKFYGKIISLKHFKEKQIKDINNPDKSKRNDLLINKIIIRNLEFDKEKKQWINGEIYSPDKGVTLDLKVTHLREKEIEVVGSKYIFWITLHWKKI